ncbi:MAG: radical SAM protein [Peptostreptococcaceae bacterium]
MVKNKGLGEICSIPYAANTYILSMTLSYDCNMRCSYCIQGIQKARDITPKDKLYHNLDRYIEYMKDRDGMVTFDILGGEITLDTQVYLDAVKYVTKHLGYEREYTLYLGTNGLDKGEIEHFIDTILEMKSNGLNMSRIHVSISLDISKESHDKHRKIYGLEHVSSYDKIRSNIIDIQEKYGKSGIRFKLSSVAHDITTLTYDNIIETMMVGDLDIRMLIQNDCDDNDIAVMARMVDIMYKVFDEQLNGRGPVNRIYLGEVGLDSLPKLLSDVDRFCPCDGHQFHINSDGNMYSCGTVKGKVRDIDKQVFLIGDNMINEMSSVCSMAVTNMCSKCDLKRFCRKGCFYYNSVSCIPWRKVQAEYTRELYRRLVSIPDFVDKLIKYYGSLGGKCGLKNFENMIDDKDKFMEDLLEVLR